MSQSRETLSTPDAPPGNSRAGDAPSGATRASNAPLARSRTELDRERGTRSGSSSAPTTGFERILAPHLGGRSGRLWRATARWIGLGCFLLGITLLLWTFVLAARGFQTFTRPDYLSMQFNRIAGDDITSRVTSSIIVVGVEAIRVGYLLILGAFASLLAARGAQFFAASDAVLDEAITGE